MSRTKFYGKRDQKLLQYVLDDFLELKTSLTPKQTSPLKRLLFSGGENGRAPSPVEGFLLARHLVVVGRSNSHTVEQLIFLNPETGRIRVKDLRL